MFYYLAMRMGDTLADLFVLNALVVYSYYCNYAAAFIYTSLAYCFNDC